MTTQIFNYSGYSISLKDKKNSEDIRLDDKEIQQDSLWVRLLLLALELVAVLLIVFFILRLFVLQPFTVVGTSMLPTLDPHDEVYVNKFSYNFKNPDRGDIVVLVPPHDTSRHYVKRIVGLPGEKIQILGDGQVVIYNEEYPSGISLKERYLPEPFITDGYALLTLEDDEYFVMGDNREASSDSRGNLMAPEGGDGSSWTLPKRNIVGKVIFRSKPYNHFHFFEHPAYNL